MKQTKRLKFYLLILSLGILGSSQVRAQFQPDSNQEITRIAFGSCAKQDKEQPVLRRVVRSKPDLFIYLGDNIYGNTRNMDKLRSKYAKLGSKREFKALCKATPVIATWDDHDYGENDAGRHYPFKEESKEIFLEFWKEPVGSPRRDHPGVYHSYMLGTPGHQVQIILLDTRTFRDNLLHSSGKPWKNDYQPNESPDSTFLGAGQWAWLETQLRIPAQIRIIASSNQFSHTYNGWESWRNVPREQERFLDLISKTGAQGIIFISGDVHWGELSRLDREDAYPIYDLTSSGITQSWHNTEPNSNRIGATIRENNFGLIDIDWEAPEPSIEFQLKNKDGETVLSHKILLSDLR